LEAQRKKKEPKKKESGSPVEIGATMEKSKTLRCFFPQWLG
jgi:hypothetical protein